MMNAEQRIQDAFHMTGKRLAEIMQTLDESPLRPALFARYQNISELRYDFPLVLTRGGSQGVYSLSGLFNTVLQKVAPRGFEGERMRKHLLRLESKIRTLVAGGASGTLSELWTAAAVELSSGAGEDTEKLEKDLRLARAALRLDGEVVDCDSGLPKRLVTHLWKRQQEVRRLGHEVDGFILRVSDILQADRMSSGEGCSADNLRASFGSSQVDAFDFGAMSKFLTDVPAGHVMPETRRKRLSRVLATLQEHRSLFVPTSDQENPLVFDSCSGALEAVRRRLPAMVDFVKAATIAQLDIDGLYEESEHDAFFDAFDEKSLGSDELARFPDFLVCVDAGSMSPGEGDCLLELLSCGLPVKVLIQSDDLLSNSSIGGHLELGPLSARIATLAVGLNQVFVLQSSASNLYQLRDGIAAGMSYAGPALFSIYAPAADRTNGLPAYLVAAAAMHSRAFPAFTFDPSSGPDLASRLVLADGNPQPERDWAVENFEYEDPDHQRVSEQLPFTFVDFMTCDSRYADHFARADGDVSLVPVAESISRPEQPISTDSPTPQIPCVLMVDGDAALQRLVVDDAMVQAARRCQQLWRTLQELGGVRNSHAEIAVEQERQAWEQKLQEAEAATAPAVEAGESAAEAVPEAAPVEAPVVERDPDEPYIDIPRCTTCNECTEINGKMFVYNDNKQAYIADPDAGTYRQMVEAAESCQVAIIHPGKPRNPDEPGLEELLERAKPFL
ncbi:MAG: ferredoxin [candidate division NC10 bacterium]